VACRGSRCATRIRLEIVARLGPLYLVMLLHLPPWLAGFDRGVVALLAPLAAAILLSGLDDLVVDLAWGWAWLKRRLRPEAGLFPPGPRQLEAAPRLRIAILIPLWQEHAVIGPMLEHNLASIRYSDYEIFAGCYPNDVETQGAVETVASRSARVHMALCPHDGPTSKADCLNWTFQRLLLHEDQQGLRYDVVVTHDAEDLIHPNELLWINYYAARYDFVQTPVLPLATPLCAITHGVYCDEFAEYHSRDMTVRAMLGGFVPSAGVGTGYRREALERLARAESNRVFEPAALTEDYENGLRLFRLGCTQAFVPITRNECGTNPAARDFMATREFFPSRWGTALLQRTRWVTGIALQGWQRFGWFREGWSGQPGEIYWLWRDRKGLIANPLSLLANAVFLYGLATSLWTRIGSLASHLAIATASLLVFRTGIRMACVARIYGAVFALGVPVRTVWANALNSAATAQAVARFTTAWALGRPLKWLKTEHSYPSRAALLDQRRKLGDILVDLGYLRPQELQPALAAQPQGLRLGEYLTGAGRLDEDQLYDALSLQQGLPVERIDPRKVSAAVARTLPGHAVRQWRVLPFRVAEGSLFIAGPELPTAAMAAALSNFTPLQLRFHLVTPSRFERLAEALL
jgi:adsorption protein B